MSILEEFDICVRSYSELTYLNLQNNLCVAATSVPAEQVSVPGASLKPQNDHYTTQLFNMLIYKFK